MLPKTEQKFLAGNTQQIAKHIADKADHETIREMLVTDKMDLEDEDWDSKIESSRVACMDAFIQNVSIMAGKAHPTADPVVKEAREQFIEKMKLGLRVAISKYQSVQVSECVLYARVWARVGLR